MEPAEIDVHAMVVSVFTLHAGIERARRERKSASSLSLLQVIAADPGIRPSEIAGRQHVHQSIVTRQIRDLEDAGYVAVTANPTDGRSCLVTLTAAGGDELARLTQIGLERFGLFVKEWEPAQVRTLTELLDKLHGSMEAVAVREQRPSASRRWARRGRQSDPSE